MNLTAVKTWSSGETLTAADLNAEFTNIYNHTITNDDIDTTDSYVLGELVVGSGISAADGGQLHVHTASAGTIQASADADEAVVENSAAAGITILSGNTSTGNLHFGDDGDNDIGKIVYDHSANTLTLTAGATAVAALAAGSFVVNEGSADIDTRVESNGLSHALYVDGGKDALVVGANSDVSSTDTPFLIDYAARTATAATNFDRAKVAGTNAITIPAGTTTLVTGLHVAEPNLTATGTITSAASLYVAAAPTEASANYALWVDAGATQLDGTLGVTGLTTATGGVTSGGNIISDTDSTDDLGTTSVRWANVYTDSIGDTGQDLTVAATTVNLPSGHIFDYNGADVTITHSANTLTIAGGTTVVDALTSGGNVISDTDSTDDLGTTSVRWANLYVDSIGDTGQALALTAGTNAISLTAGDVTIFDDNNNADTSLSIGTSATEALKVEVLNGAANKTAEEVRFTTSTASATADHGKMSFYVDDAEIATIDDGGIDLAAGLAFTVNGAAVGGADPDSTNTWTADQTLNDNVKHTYGTGGDADIYYDGTNLVLEPQVVGSGALVINDAANVFLNDTANAQTTVGLTINQGANDDQTFALKSSDVAHGCTAQAETDTYFKLQKRDATYGGTIMTALAEDNASVANSMIFQCYGATAETGKTTASRGLVFFDINEISGTNVTSVTANGNIFALACDAGSGGVARFLVDEDGDFWSVTAGQTFDDHDDLALVDAYDTVRDGYNERLPAEAVKNEMGRWNAENEAKLIELGILGAPLAEGGMTNIPQLQRLHNGAIRQLGERTEALNSIITTQAKEIAELRGELMRLQEKN